MVAGSVVCHWRRLFPPELFKNGGLVLAGGNRQGQLLNFLGAFERVILPRRGTQIAVSSTVSPQHQRPNSGDPMSA